MLDSGQILFRAGIAVAAVNVQAIRQGEIDRDSAHIYVKDRWSFPHTQFAIDRAADHK